MFVRQFIMPSTVRRLVAGAVLMAISWAGAGETVTHKLTFVHPGDPDARPLPHELVQHVDGAGEPSGYHMWVDSVICRDETCDVVLVKLLWDELGRYQRYEVAKGEKLTKLDHEPFTKEDHAKLQRILLDNDSPLSEVTKEGLTGPSKKKQKDAGVDGVAGATVLTLSANVIIGAGYTCYDLWHWANGEVTELTQGLTGKACSDQRLRQYLVGNDQRAVRFALTHLHARKLADSATLKAAVNTVIKGDASLIEPALAYFREANTDYHQLVAQIFEAASSEQRTVLLNQLKIDKNQAPNTFYDQLSQTLPKLESHHEVHLFLDLMKTRNPKSTIVIQQAAKLLNHKKFFIARRAFYFLEPQSLPKDVAKQVDAFEDKHWDRL